MSSKSKPQACQVPEEAKLIFMDKIPIADEVNENEDPDGAAEDTEPKFEERLNEKIIPQYTTALEADDASLCDGLD
jgi:hypothetical protein